MIRVLIVDDSAVIREQFRAALARDPEIEVVGAAANPYEARELLVGLRPDVMTLDMEMPRMDGLTFLRKVMRFHPVRTVVASSLTDAGSDLALQAFHAGALEVLQKPGSSLELPQMVEDLVRSVRAAAAAKAPAPVAPEAVEQESGAVDAAGRVVLVGSSTGGPLALETLLGGLRGAPPVLVAQHMPGEFTGPLARRLARSSGLDVREARDGEPLAPGMVRVAPGGRHLLLRAGPSGFLSQVKTAPRVNGHAPSVDVLFRSAAQCGGGRCVGVLLTGMGADGARGLLAMREAGAVTLAQDEATSVVFGMPGAAAELDAVDELVPIQRMGAHILRALKRPAPAAS